MKGLAKFLVETILDEAAEMDKVVVVYSGRFQPFHKGHYATYENLIRKFGKDSVYIGTSNVTDSKKSPFNFKEKKAIMMQMFGIPSSKIVNVKNPYRPEEILNKFDSDTTGLIVVVGEKDQNRLSGNYFTPYKGKVEQGYLDKGYVYASPAQPNLIG
jgi:nicotinamide mononucleotide adenylyltransferase